LFWLLAFLAKLVKQPLPHLIAGSQFFEVRPKPLGFNKALLISAKTSQLYPTTAALLPLSQCQNIFWLRLSSFN